MLPRLSNGHGPATRNQLVSVAIGGVKIIIPMYSQPEIPLLIDAGFLMTGAVKGSRMGSVRGSTFAAKLWREKKVELTGIGSGLALQENGLWVWDKWGLTGDTIIEPELCLGSIPLLGYFGRVLEGEEADQFARDWAPHRPYKSVFKIA